MYKHYNDIKPSSFWHDRQLFFHYLMSFGFVVLGVLILIRPAIENGFPLLHHDSGTYLLEGFNHKIPVSRPITYCLFVRFLSRIFSIWTVIITQALITYFIIWLSVATFLSKKNASWLTFLIVAVLATVTGISVYVSQIMADIFMPIAILGTMVFIFRENFSLFKKIITGLIIWLALIVHMSNLPIITSVTLALLLLLALFYKTLKVFYKNNIKFLLLVMLLSWLTNPVLSVFYGEGFRLSNSSGIVFFSRLLQSGATQEYLRHKCSIDDEFYLCKYLDDIDRYNRLDVFLWLENSLLYDHPCSEKTWDACWRERNKEFGAINSDILSHPPSRKLYFKAVGKDFFDQLVSFGLTTYVSFKTDSHINYPLKVYYKNDYLSFQKSRQFQGTLVFREQNKIIHWTIYISLLIITSLFIRRKTYRNLQSYFLVFIITLAMYWLANAALTATLAVVSDRFLGRFIWLIPFLAIIMIYKEYEAHDREHSSLQS
jgi:hypothetical protein